MRACLSRFSAVMEYRNDGILGNGDQYSNIPQPSFHFPIWLRFAALRIRTGVNQPHTDATGVVSSGLSDFVTILIVSEISHWELPETTPGSECSVL